MVLELVGGKTDRYICDETISMCVCVCVNNIYIHI